MNKEIIQIQIAWFFSNVYNGKFEDFSLKLKNKLGESNTTHQLPVPPDAPAEIPRLIISYPNFNLNVSKNRLDLFLKDIQLTKNISSNINDVILNELSLQVGRIGFVKNYFIDGNIERLKQLLAEEKIKKLNLKEINIRINEVKISKGYEYNSIENLSNGSITKKETDGAVSTKTGIIIMRDLNTLEEKISENKFNREEINELINTFEEESNTFVLVNFE